MMTVDGEGMLKREGEPEEEREREIRSRVRCTRSHSLRFIDADI